MSVARFNFSHGSHDYHQASSPQILSNIDPTKPWCDKLTILVSCAGNTGLPATGNEKHQDHVRRDAGHKGMARKWCMMNLQSFAEDDAMKVQTACVGSRDQDRIS